MTPRGVPRAAVIALGLLVAALLTPVHADAMAKYVGWAISKSGLALSGVTVTVTLASTGATATIYSDDGVTAQTNPFTSAADGSYTFYAANGRYSITFAKSGYTFDATDTADLLLFDPAAAAITAGTGTGVTVVMAGEPRRLTYKVTATYAALAAAALTADKTIATLPAKTALCGIRADTTTPYTGGGVTAATLIVGKTVGGNEYLVSHDVFSAAVTKGNADADLGTSINRANAVQGCDLPSWTATTAVSVRLTTVTANTNALTAGSTTFYLVTERMP